MPLYIYQCDKCEHADEVFQRMSDRAHSICPKCDDRHYHRVPTLPLTDIKEFHKPIEMHSIGLAHADEIEAFQRRNPDAKISTDEADPLYGVPIAHTRKEKLAILKTEGFRERK